MANRTESSRRKGVGNHRQPQLDMDHVLRLKQMGQAIFFSMLLLANTCDELDGIDIFRFRFFCQSLRFAKRGKMLRKPCWI